MYDNRNVLKLIMYTKGLLKMKGGKVRYIDSVFPEMYKNDCSNKNYCSCSIISFHFFLFEILRIKNSFSPIMF